MMEKRMSGGELYHLKAPSRISVELEHKKFGSKTGPGSPGSHKGYILGRELIGSRRSVAEFFSFAIFRTLFCAAIFRGTRF